MATLELLLAATVELADDPLSQEAQDQLTSRIQHGMGWRYCHPHYCCSHTAAVSTTAAVSRSSKAPTKIYVMCREFVLAGAVGCRLGVWGGSPVCKTGTVWCLVTLGSANELLCFSGSEIGPAATAWFEAIKSQEELLDAGSQVLKILSAVEKISYPLTKPPPFQIFEHGPNNPILAAALERQWDTPVPQQPPVPS